jgi:hypothetical protein
MRRIKERYGIEANSSMIKFMITLIQKNKAEFVTKISLSRSLWKVPIADNNVLVIYDKNRKYLITALPANM